MTPVEFQFNYPDGRPIANEEFTIVLSRSGFVKTEDGVLMPSTHTFVTDVEGKFTVPLAPSNTPYRVKMLSAEGHVGESDCVKAIYYTFYVPDSEEAVRAQDLFLAPPPSNLPYDEEALLVIMDAKSASMAAARRAEAAAIVSESAAESADADARAALNSATSAAVSAQDALNSKTAAAASQVSASTSAGTATTKANEAKASATAAAASEAAALASKNAAATSATNAGNSATAAAASRDAAAASAVSANTSAGTATTKASEASASAASALASKNSAATSATDALASKSAAAASATAAKTSETNAANSASTASTAGAAAGKTAAEAVVDGKQDKNTNLTFLSALTPLANAVITYNAGGNGYVAKPVTDFVLAGQYGIGAITSPRLPDDNANAQLPAGNYHTAGSWTGSVIAGSTSNNQGTLEVTPWGIATYIRQRWSSIMSAIGTYERFCVLGVWGEWLKVLHEGDSVWGTGKTLPLAVDMFNLPGTGFYYSNPSAGTTNQMSSAAGAVMHVAGARGFQFWGGDNTLLFRGFTGTTFQPPRSIYHDSNVVGAGGIIERGNTANGEYTKFIDGTLLMWGSAVLVHEANVELVSVWTFPTAALATGSPQITVSDAGPGSTQNYKINKMSGALLNTTSGRVRTSYDIAQTYTLSYSFRGRWK